MDGTRDGAARTEIRRGARWALGAAGLLAAAIAQAQSSACDTLKSKLAARIESTGVRGYAMDLVPGRASVPSGAKVIGNCDGGAFKVVYWRWASARKAGGALADVKVAAVLPAPAPAPAPAPVRAVTAAVAPSPSVASAPVSEPTVVPPAPMTAMPIAVPSIASSTPAATPSMPLMTASVDSPRMADDRVAVPALPQPAKTETRDDQPFARQVSAFVSDRWPWFTALLLVPLGLWFWAWRAHRNAYDEAGLPRGPKL